MVLKMKIQINHVKWLFLSAFNIAVKFPTESQTAIIIITESRHHIIE